MVSNQEQWQICREVQEVLNNHNISCKYNKEIMEFVLKVTETETKEEVEDNKIKLMFLYFVRKDFFLDLEGIDNDYTDDEYVFRTGERYFVKWEEGLEWPQIYIPKYKEWYDITLDCYKHEQEEDFTYLTDDIHNDVFMEMVPMLAWRQRDADIQREILNSL